MTSKNSKEQPFTQRTLLQLSFTSEIRAGTQHPPLALLVFQRHCTPPPPQGIRLLCDHNHAKDLGFSQKCFMSVFFLNTFKIAELRFSCNNFNICISFGQVFTDCCITYVQVMQFFTCLVNFVNNYTFYVIQCRNTENQILCLLRFCCCYCLLTLLFICLVTLLKWF